jgi:DNA (cytosine-5)-methyltransferase 1
MKKSNLSYNFKNIKFRYPPILSFFTGAGFLDLGFTMAGFPVIWRNEVCKEFIEGFEYGMDSVGLKHKGANNSSIVDLGPNQIAKEAFNGLGKVSEFGIVGGPPCPDFSVGGKNRGHTGERGKLSLVYINRILELQPTFFLFENVPGLLRTSKHRQFLSHLISLLSKQYLVDLRVVNALDYGVPQDRERVILVGFRKSWLCRKYGIPQKNMGNYNELLSLMLTKPSIKLNAVGWFPWEKGRKYTNAKALFQWPELNPFGNALIMPSGLPSDLMVGPLICDQNALAILKNSDDIFQPYSKKFNVIFEGDVSRKSFKRLHRWRYSPAAAYGNNEVHLHPCLPRRLSVREAMRIQTVPDEYALPEDMTLSSKFKTIGNGVPVHLAAALASGFAAVLKGEMNAEKF